MTPGCDPQAAAEFLRALAHPMRLQILCRLLEGELSVGGFENELGLKQPNLSQQLAHLRDARLVTTRREAKSVFYRLDDDRVGIILGALRAIQTGKPTVAAPPAPRLAGRLARQAPTEAPAPAKSDNAECGRFAAAGWDLPSARAKTR